MSHVHRIAGLRISRVDPVFSTDTPPIGGWRPKDNFPDLEPVDDRLRRLKRQIFESDTIALVHEAVEDDPLGPENREEHFDMVAWCTVYVANMIVLVMSLPVGLGLLCFNILAGENLRTTLHVIALTGMYIGLGIPINPVLLY